MYYLKCILVSEFTFWCAIFPSSWTSPHLLCHEQGNCFIEEHREAFLGLAYQSTFLDNCLYLFLYANLKTATKAQLSREGPQGSLDILVEWVLVSCEMLLNFHLTPTIPDFVLGLLIAQPPSPTASSMISREFVSP